jgi:tetratricopeptide (TPR) repeat protein
MNKQEQEIEKYLNQAADLLDSEDQLSAVKVYEKGFEKTKDWRFINEAGICYQRLNMFPEAAQAFKKALPIAPDRFFILFNIGITYSMMNEFEQAIEALTEIWNEKLDIKAAFEIGYAEMKLKKFEEAIAWFDKAIFYDVTLNGYNMSGSEGLNPELAARVFLNKARIYGLELNEEEKARKMIECLKDEVDDEDRLFKFAKEALDNGKKELAKYAASMLTDFYQQYEDVFEFCESLDVVPI